LESTDWWPELLRLQDHLPLKDLAERFGVSVNGLSRALKRAGIQHRPVRHHVDGGPGGAGAPDPRSAEAQDWWDEFLALKDRQSLSKLARRFGVAEITLQRALKRTGIDRRSQRGARAGRESRKAARLIKPHADLLGKIPDGEVARLAGVSRYAVAQYRKRRSIPSVRTGQGRPSAPPPIARASGEVEAWLVRVTMEGGRVRSFVVASPSIEEVVPVATAQVAERLAGTKERWSITGLELVGVPL
jgi:transcriptional regulator with XRE-family HTH domain